MDMLAKNKIKIILPDVSVEVVCNTPMSNRDRIEFIAAVYENEINRKKEEKTTRMVLVDDQTKQGNFDKPSKNSFLDILPEILGKIIPGAIFTPNGSDSGCDCEGDEIPEAQDKKEPKPETQGDE